MVPHSTMIARLSPQIGALVARYRYAVAALDQIALSLFGFALNLCLIRALSATDFGMVSLWLGISQLAIGVQNALVSGPLNVQLPTTPDAGARQRLAAALETINLLLIMATALATGVVVFAADAEWTPKGVLAAIAIPLFVAVGMYREYYRAMAFGRSDTPMLLWTDVPYFMVTGGCLVAILLRPDEFATSATAFVAMSAGCIVSQICLRVVYRHQPQALFREGWIAAYRSIGREVWWSLVGVFASHIETRGYIYIVTSLVGLAALAAINAVGTLFKPVSVLMNAWARSALPYLATALAGGEIAKFDRAFGRALGAAGVGSIALAGLLWLLWQPLNHYLLADKYADSAALLLPWAAASGATVLRYVAGVALQAAREYKFLAQALLFCGAISVVATVALVTLGGYSWAMYGIAIGNAVCFALELDRLRRIRRRALGAARDTVPYSPTVPAGEG